MKTSIYIFIFFILLGCKSNKVELSDFHNLNEINKVSDNLEKYSDNLEKIKLEYTANSFKIEFYDNGFPKSIGKIDPKFLSDLARTGLWSTYYENGKLKETGEYKADFYTNCCSSGSCSSTYSYKIGEWNYYHENGQLKANGIYKIDKKHIETSCEGGSKINFGFIDNNWKFYNKKGIPITLLEKEIKEIENNGFVNEMSLIKN